MDDRSSFSPNARGSPACSPLATLPGCACSIAVNPPPNRPDPAIYSQAARVSAGLDAAWDNPDIKVFAPPNYVGGEWLRSEPWLFDRAEVSIHNRSPTVSAINTVVRVTRGRYGIGMQRTPVVTQLLSLGPGDTTKLDLPLGAFHPIYHDNSGHEVRITGHTLFVDITHPYDADVTNNRGESVVGLATIATRLSQGNDLPIPIGNYTDQPLTYVLSLLPNNVTAQINAPQVTVAPESSQLLYLHCNIPPTKPFSTSITLLAEDLEGHLLGGLTQYLYY